MTIHEAISKAREMGITRLIGKTEYIPILELSALLQEEAYKPPKGIQSNFSLQTPSLEELLDYAKQLRYYNFDAKHFVDFYSKRNWTIKGEPIRNWKALVRAWKDKEEKFGGRKSSSDPYRGLFHVLH